MSDTDDLLAPDLVAQARAMWGSQFWQRMVTYLTARREALLAAVDPPPDTRAVWIREGAVAELNRMLRGDAFLADVIRSAQERRAQGDEAPAQMPLWMHPTPMGDVVD